MLKKITVFIVTIVLVIGSASIAFAGSPMPTHSFGQAGQDILQYVGVKQVEASLAIDGSTAKVYVIVVPKREKNIDKVEIKGNLIRGGSTIKSWSATIYPNASNKFVWGDTYGLSKSGTYSFSVTIECYSNDTLVETISKTSQKVKY